MHREHNHGHDGHRHPHVHAAAPGHNGPGAAQWQIAHGSEKQAPPAPEATDLDLVEAAFCEAFPSVKDALSFLRLAGVVLEGYDAAGVRLQLLRVETQDTVDVGALTPHLGGSSFRFDPLPGRMASRRKRLAFLYFNGAGLKPLSLAAARGLTSDPMET